MGDTEPGVDGAVEAEGDGVERNEGDEEVVETEFETCLVTTLDSLDRCSWSISFSIFCLSSTIGLGDTCLS